jgi:hypothetical protein
MLQSQNDASGTSYKSQSLRITFVLYAITESFLLHNVAVLYTPLEAFEHLFFAVFGMSNVKDVQKSGSRPAWTEYLFKIMFMVYMSVSVVVLINLLIAMMSDTYQRIQAQSDIEWKYGLAKLIRNMHRTTTTPSPLNLMTSWFMYLLQLCKRKGECPLTCDSFTFFMLLYSITIL